MIRKPDKANMFKKSSSETTDRQGEFLGHRKPRKAALTREWFRGYEINALWGVVAFNAVLCKSVFTLLKAKPR